MWPFQSKENEKKQMKDEADYQMSASILGNPQGSMDEQDLIEKRNMLVQLQQWQQDRKPVMRELFCKLSGTLIDQKGKIVSSQWNHGYVSIAGAAKLVDFIEPLDHNVMLANWDDMNLTKTLRDAIAHPLRRYLYQNHQELSLALAHAEYVFWLIVNTVEPNYRRGWNNGERIKDTKIIKVNELHNPHFQPKKKGIFGIET